jgi:hypothetical protein
MQSLPNEVVLEISKYLEGIDLGRFSMVNKKLYNLLEPNRKIKKLWLNKKRFIRRNDPLPDYVSIDPEFIFHCIRCNAKVDGLA